MVIWSSHHACIPSAVHECSKFLHCCYCLLSFYHFWSMQCPLIEVPLMTDSFQNLFICFLTISGIFILMCLYVYLSVFWSGTARGALVSLFYHSLPDSNETGLLIEPRLVDKPQRSFSLYLLQQDGSRGILGQPAFLRGCWRFEPMSL